MIDFTPQQAFSVASNIVDGDNPPFTCADFRAMMPAFTRDIIKDEQLQHFIDISKIHIILFCEREIIVVC